MRCISPVACLAVFVILFTAFSAKVIHAEQGSSFLPAIFHLLSPKFKVVSTTPIDGKTNVYLDVEVKVIFSSRLDQDTPLSAFSIKDSKGIKPEGKWVLSTMAAIYAPVRLQPLETYTVKVTTAVRGGMKNLPAEYTFQFTTGETGSSGVYPPTLKDSPLGPYPRVTLSKRPEYVIAWTTESEVRFPSYPSKIPGGPDFVVENPSDDPSTGTAVNLEKNDLLLPEADKWLVSGQFDDDLWDEIIVFQRVYGNVFLVLSDTTAPNTFIMKEFTSGIPPWFGIGGSIQALDAVAADFDSDGRDEIFILWYEQQGERLCYSIIDYNADFDTYILIAQNYIPISNRPSRVEVRVAAGDNIDADNKPEAVLMWINYKQAEAPWVSMAMVDDMSTNMSVRLWDPLSLGDGKVLPIPIYPLDFQYCPSPTVSMITADADADGADEIFLGVSRYSYSSLSVPPASPRCELNDVLYFMDNTTDDDPILPLLHGGNASETGSRGLLDFSDYSMVPFPDHDFSMPTLAGGRFSGHPLREEIFFR